MMRSTLGSGLLVFSLVATAFSQQSVPLSPTQAPAVTAPEPQRQNPPAQQQPLSGVPRTAPQPLTNMHAPYTGTIEGYVYWNASAVSHKPAGSCSGLSITVSLGTPLGGSGMEQFNPLSTLSNNFKYVGSVGPYGVCTYGFDHVPVGQDMQVQVNVTTPLAFSPIAMPQVAITGPVNIINGKCNNLPHAVPLPSDLTAHWWTCGNYAYNVNFVLQPAAHVTSATGRTGGAGLLSGSSSTQGTLLSNTPNRGMLAGGAAGVQTQTVATTVPQTSTSGGGAVTTAPVPTTAGIQVTSTGNPAPIQTTSSQSGSSAAAGAAPPIAAGAFPPASNSGASRTGTAPQTISPGIQAAMACGQNSTFRILGVSGLSKNTFLPSGMYTIWGCSFGTMALAKAPAPQRSQRPTAISGSPTPASNSVFVIGSGSGLSGMIPIGVGANIDSWSDNSITVTFPSAAQVGNAASQSTFGVQLYVMRGDGQTTSQSGYSFQFPPPAPPPSCAQGNSFLVTNVAPSPIRAGGQYKISGCGFGSSGGLDLYGGSAQLGTDFIAFLHVLLWTDTEIDFTFSTADVKSSPSLNQTTAILTVTRSSDNNSIQTGVVFHN